MTGIYSAWSPNYEPVEISCDGLDNDCDAMYDEDLGGQPCDTGMFGNCAEGVSVCEGPSGLLCQPLYPPEPEVCDDLDNDCDGMTDEGGSRQRGLLQYGPVGNLCGRDAALCGRITAVCSGPIGRAGNL